MIYVQVDFMDASSEEQAAIADNIEKLRASGCVVSIHGLDEAVEALSNKLKQIFADQKMSEDALLNENKLFRMLQVGGLNPAEKKIAPRAFDLLCSEGVLREAENGYHLTKYGERVIYSD